MTDIFKVPRVSATLASLDNFNNPLAYILDALNTIADTQSKLYNKSSIVLFDQPVSQDSSIGDLVYYDTTNAVFSPAVAELAALPGRQGQSVLSPRSRVVGMLVSAPVEQGVHYVATILCGGMYKDGVVASACLGTDALPGTYYLSPWTAGKAVLLPEQNLRQPVLQYMGDGKFTLNYFYLAHDGHQHASATLQHKYWTLDAVSGKYVYDINSLDLAFVALGQISALTTAIFAAGKLQVWGLLFDVDTLLGLTASELPDAADTLVLMNHYPLAYGAPVVRDVVSSAAGLTTYKKGGIVLIAPVPYSYNTKADGLGYAVYDITGSEIIRHPVVNEVIAGIGIDVHAKLGTVTITNKALDSIYADATMINLNGAVHIELNGLTFIVFPAGRQTSVNMYYPVNYVLDVAKATVWMQYSTLTAAEAYISLSYIPLPDTPGTLVEIPRSGLLRSLALSAVSSGNLNFALTDAIHVSKPGYLCASIKITPTSHVKLLRQGFRVATEV